MELRSGEGTWHDSSPQCPGNCMSRAFVDLEPLFLATVSYEVFVQSFCWFGARVPRHSALENPCPELLLVWSYDSSPLCLESTRPELSLTWGHDSSPQCAGKCSSRAFVDLESGFLATVAWKMLVQSFCWFGATIPRHWKVLVQSFRWLGATVPRRSVLGSAYPELLLVWSHDFSPQCPGKRSSRTLIDLEPRFLATSSCKVLVKSFCWFRVTILCHSVLESRSARPELLLIWNHDSLPQWPGKCSSRPIVDLGTRFHAPVSWRVLVQSFCWFGSTIPRHSVLEGARPELSLVWSHYSSPQYPGMCSSRAFVNLESRCPGKCLSRAALVDLDPSNGAQFCWLLSKMSSDPRQQVIHQNNFVRPPRSELILTFPSTKTHGDLPPGVTPTQTVELP